MRVLIQSISFAPDLTGTARTMGELAAGLARGHEVRVVTAPPYYPQWRIARGYRGWRYRRESSSEGRLRVWRCPLYVPRKPSGPKRLLHYASFVLSSLPVMLRQAAWRPEVVVLAAPTLLCAPVSLLAGKLSGARTWLSVLDFEVDAAFDLGLLRSTILRRAVWRVETALLRRFDRVSSLSDAMLARARAKGVEKNRLVYLPVWADLDGIQEDRKAGAELRRVWDIPEGQLVVSYSGSLGLKQGLDIIVETARLLQERSDILFLICGFGPMREQLTRAAGKLPNLRVHDLVPAEQFNGLLNLADVHLLPQRGEAADWCVPGKVLHMLASGRPVVATAAPDTELGRLIQRAGGLIVPAGDALAVKAALLELARDEARRQRAGASGRAIVESEFERGQVLRKLEGEMQELIGGRARGPAAPAASSSL